MPCPPSLRLRLFWLGADPPPFVIPAQPGISLCFTPLRNPLLTDLPQQRQINCEEPNFSCDDRCNAPIIRRKGSALLFPLAIQK